MRRAAALPAVLLTVALTSALAAGSVYVSRQYIAGSRLASGGLHLQPRVETALSQALTSWDSIARATQPLGTTVALAETWITRLDDRLYFVVSQASRTQPPSLHRRSGLLAITYGGKPRPLSGRAFFELP